MGKQGKECIHKDFFSSLKNHESANFSFTNVT